MEADVLELKCPGDLLSVCLSASRRQSVCACVCVCVLSRSLRVVLLVPVQLVRVIGGHVGEVLENVLVGFIPCEEDDEKRQ